MPSVFVYSPPIILNMKTYIDFETYSEHSLTKYGTWNYSRHPSTRVICMSYAIDDNEPELIVKKKVIKEAIQDWILSSNTEFYAWHSFFECAIINNVLDLKISDFYQWNDVMAWAAASALPQSLDNCAKAFFPKDRDSQKAKEGKSLISKLCVPQKMSWIQLGEAGLWKGENPKIAKIIMDALALKKQAIKSGVYSRRGLEDQYNYMIRRFRSVLVHPKYKHLDYAILLKALGDYCKQDVVVMRKLSHFIRPLDVTEHKIWVQDQLINWKGIKCDTTFCINATKIFENSKKENVEKMKWTTGIKNPNSTAQLLPWLQQFISIDNLQAATVREALLDESIPDHVREVLALRSSSSRTPPKKYVAMLDRADLKDKRIRGILSYHGASTGRWTSKGINVQNLPRPNITHFLDPVDIILDNDEVALEAFYGDKITMLCGLVRCALIPSKNNVLVVSDYASIEARVLAWMASSLSLLKVFKTHGKAYEHTAAQIYDVPIRGITPKQRFIGKTSLLALGYQGSTAAFLRMAKSFGVEIPEEFATTIVKKWRAANPEIVKLWYATQRTAIEAVLSPGKKVRVNDYLAFKSVYYKSKPYLLCKLPSGRLLTYVAPKIIQGDYGNQITYLGVNSFTRQWQRMETYGGQLVQNATQAIARDILAQAKLNLVGTDYDNIVLSVHDEIICDVPSNIASADKLSELMCEVPTWAKGLPIAAKGEVTTRYWK